MYGILMCVCAYNYICWCRCRTRRLARWSLWYICVCICVTHICCTQVLNKATGEVVTAKDIILAPGSVPFVPPGVQVWPPVSLLSFSLCFYLVCGWICEWVAECGSEQGWCARACTRARTRARTRTQTARGLWTTPACLACVMVYVPCPSVPHKRRILRGT